MVWKLEYSERVISIYPKSFRLSSKQRARANFLDDKDVIQKRETPCERRGGAGGALTFQNAFPSIDSTSVLPDS